MANHLTPLEVCEALIGRREHIGDLLGIDPKSPYQWRHERGARAAGDLPYVSYLRRLLTHSTTYQLGLELEHLIFGASRAEIDEILKTRRPRMEAAE